MSTEPKQEGPPSWRLLALLFVINVLLTTPYWSLYFGMDDEAITVLGAQRLLRGEWPYYHWDTRHTPGSYLMATPFFALVGSDRVAVRLLMGLVAAASGLLVFAIGRLLFPPRLALLPWFLWASAGLVNFPILNHHWFGTLTTLLGLYWAVRWQRGESRAAYGLGASLALAAWTLQSDGLAIGLMIGLTWLRYRPAGLRRVLTSALLVSLLLWLPFLPCLGEVLRQNLWDMREHVSYNRYAYRWDSWLALARLLRDSPPPLWYDRLALASHFWLQTCTYGGYYLLILGCLVCFQALGRRDLSVLALGALAWALASGNRQTVAYLSFSSPAIFLLLTGLLSLLRQGQRLALGLALLEAVGWGARSLHLQNSWTSAIVTRAGLYRTNNPLQAQALGVLREWSDRFFPPGSRVLAYPYLCSFYTTEKLRNPIRQPVLTPFLYSRSEVEQVSRRLDGVEWIVYVPLSPEQMQSSYGIPAELYARVAAEELAIVTKDYSVVAQNGSLRLFRRKQ